MVAGAAGQVVVCGLEENAAVDRRIKVTDTRDFLFSVLTSFTARFGRID